MSLGSGMHKSAKENRKHLRKTKENMIKPFAWKIGKKGPALFDKKLNCQEKKDIADKMKKQNRIALIKFIVILSVLISLFSWLLYYGLDDN